MTLSIWKEIREFERRIEQPNYSLKHFAKGKIGQRTDKPKDDPEPVHRPKNR